MLIHVQIDPTLHGNAATVVDTLNQCDSMPAKILYAGNLVSFTSATRIKRDSKAASARASVKNTCVLLLSRDLLESLYLPQKTLLHCVFDGDTWRVGPCLAVYVRSNGNRKFRFGPQNRLLKDLAVMAGEKGVDLVVISPGFTKTGKGWRYDSDTRNWVESQLGQPDVILRRSGGFESTEGGQVTTELRKFAAEGVLHTLPRFYTNKWMMHRFLSQSSYLKPYLLDTYLAEDANDVFSLAHKHTDVYIKPLAGAQGHRVYHIQSINGILQIEWQKPGTNQGGKILHQKRMSCDLKDFLQFWKSTGLKKCIVQETFMLPRIRGGTPFDLRWLVQFTDGPEVTARMARIGQPDSVTTNLHTGGKPVDAAQLLEQLKWERTDDIIARLDEVAIRVAEACVQRYGPIAELGVDLAVNERGDMRVFEINSTPGRRMLKLAAPALRTLSLRNLLEYAINAAGFTGES